MTGVVAGSGAAQPREPEREIRFALVMYGGVSLAIYMNGIAQELLRLVRATAPGARQRGPAPDETSQDVYAEIGHELGARFLVDILSGSSAGGINAVFLAKALATGGNLTSLQQTWIEEGDVKRLIFDRDSVKGERGLRLPASPPSLFNGDRMYRKLLGALDAVDDGKSDALAVEEVELFVTATDLEGLALDIALSDGLVREKRYRTLFKFQRGDGKGDFGKQDNAFLAFVARCTSSFPVAFEPPRLDDLKRILPGSYCADLEGKISEWSRFFPDYTRPGEHRTRVFADGGYLDNKPFECVLEAIETSDGRMPVERVLVYVEPDPDHPDDEANAPDWRPDAAMNVLSAFTLARKETIRDDLRRVNVRKRYLERVRRIINDVYHDARHQRDARRSMPGDRWGQATVEELVKTNGAAYGAYHRAKVGAVTDELTRGIARMFGAEDDSDRRFTVWLLVRAWRKHFYFCYEPKEGQQSETKFLMDYDVAYRARRLQFLRQVLDDLLQTGIARDQATKAGVFEGVDQSPGALWEKVLKRANLGMPDLAKREARRALSDARSALHGLARGFERRRRALPGEWLKAMPPGTSAFDPHQLVELAMAAGGGRVTTDMDFNSPAISNGIRQAMIQLADIIAVSLRDEFKDLAAAVRKLMPESGPSSGSTPPPVDTAWVPRLLGYFYAAYEDYDTAILPLLQGTGIPQLGSLDVYRISPDDSALRSGASKLGGSKLGAFGAFFDKGWRSNDLLWGRLDAAQRLIEILLPGSEGTRSQRREALIARAQHAIVREEAASVINTTSIEAFLSHLRQEASQGADLRRVASALRSEAEYLKMLQKQSPGSFGEQPTLLQTTSRAAVVASDLLGAIVQGSRAEPVTAALARFTQVALALVRVSTPGHPFRHFALGPAVLVAASAVTIIIAAPFINTDLLPFGIWLLAALFVAVLIVGVINGLIRGKYGLVRGLVACGALAVFVLSIIGGVVVFQHLRARLLPLVASQSG